LKEDELTDDLLLNPFRVNVKEMRNLARTYIGLVNFLSTKDIGYEQIKKVEISRKEKFFLLSKDPSDLLRDVISLFHREDKILEDELDQINIADIKYVEVDKENAINYCCVVSLASGLDQYDLLMRLSQGKFNLSKKEFAKKICQKNPEKFIQYENVNNVEDLWKKYQKNNYEVKVLDHAYLKFIHEYLNIEIKFYQKGQKYNKRCFVSSLIVS
jgi:hypothetical protein